MCFVAATAAIAAASALVQYQGKQADFQAERSRYEQNDRNALAAAQDSQQALTMRQMQEAALTSQRLTASQLDQARRQAEAQVTGADAGIGGSISLDSLVADIGARSEANRATLITNWENTASQLQAQKDATVDTAEGHINDLPSGTPPNPLSPALGVAGAAAKFGAQSEAADRAALNADA